MRLSHRFALTGAAAALVPLLVFGGLAVQALDAGMRDAVGRGMSEVTTRTAAQIDQWVSRTASLLVALGAELQGTDLSPWQQERAVRNYLLAFPEFRSITLYSAQGRPLASTRLAIEALPPPPDLPLPEQFHGRVPGHRVANEAVAPLGREGNDDVHGTADSAAQVEAK